MSVYDYDRDTDRYEQPTSGLWWFGIEIAAPPHMPTDKDWDDTLYTFAGEVAKAMQAQGSDDDVIAQIDDWDSRAIGISFILDGWYEDSAREVARQVARHYGVKEVTYELNGNQRFHKLPVE